MQEHHFTTQRTARFYTSGDITKNIKTVWLACHGYAQLAGEFIKELDPLAADDALVVAPEALSRFYTKGFFGTVGATWMTKEDRESEIADYVNYLQSLYEKLKTEVSKDAPFHILGFSQGCSTVCRWIARKKPGINGLWLCSGSIPDDLDFDQFRKAIQQYPAHFFIGDEDPFIGEKDRAAFMEKMNARNLPIMIHEFKGGHVLNIPLIKSLL